jgi:hypothetical protein
MNARERGDLAEDMLPKACLLSVLIHGDGGPEDVAEVLAGLDETQKNALIVVLAGMVDPEQPVGKALGWVDFTENGDLAVPASWSQSGSIRDLARSIVTGKRYPEFGGPIRTVRSARSLKASREHMCGHGEKSKASLSKKQLEEAA